jgi:hypothetical protein
MSPALAVVSAAVSRQSRSTASPAPIVSIPPTWYVTS